MASQFLTSLEKKYQRSILFYILHSFRTRGVWGSLRLWAREAVFCIREGDRYWLSRPFLDKLASQEKEANNPFQATYFSVAKDALSIVRDQEGAVSLCDIGAGHGRVARIALDLGFPDVYGIEIDRRWQAALHDLREKSSGRFDFIIGDALDVMPKRRFEVVYLFNPMSRDKFSKFLESVTLGAFRPTTFILVNPRYDDLMAKAGYQATHSRSTFRHVEYRIFRYRKP